MKLACAGQVGPPLERERELEPATRDTRRTGGGSPCSRAACTRRRRPAGVHAGQGQCEFAVGQTTYTPRPKTWLPDAPLLEGPNNRGKRAAQPAHQDEPPSAWAREQSLRAACESNKFLVTSSSGTQTRGLGVGETWMVARPPVHSSCRLRRCALLQKPRLGLAVVTAGGRNPPSITPARPSGRRPSRDEGPMRTSADASSEDRQNDRQSQYWVHFNKGLTFF